MEGVEVAPGDREMEGAAAATGEPGPAGTTFAPASCKLRRFRMPPLQGRVGATTGRFTVTRVPRPGALSTWISPPCARTI